MFFFISDIWHLTPHLIGSTLFVSVRCRPKTFSASVTKSKTWIVEKNTKVAFCLARVNTDQVRWHKAILVNRPSSAIVRFILTILRQDFESRRHDGSALFFATKNDIDSEFPEASPLHRRTLFECIQEHKKQQVSVARRLADEKPNLKGYRFTAFRICSYKARFYLQ